MMLGIQGVMDYVEGRLRDAMPSKLVELRTKHAVSERLLPDVRRFLTREPSDVAIDKPPMIVIAEQESDTLEGPVRVTDDGGGGSVYRYRYTLLIMAWATGDDFDSTARARRLYGLAVRECLLQRPGLGDPDPGTCVILPGLIRETYSEVGQEDARSRKAIAATAIEVVYETQEYLPPWRPPVVQTAPPSTDLGVEP